ncbi:D-2-hydroxyacid dehydrogenase [Shouchella shacheensis]|uniref:D-2-hydroxyacid dehydrogenase n=1 Tax=Shouchella shacheensis TaxID=1649580 RepID=UPI00073FADC2|nr:D-2-hydroxyacid dehydrogenase [Shouchella shacheensis]
MKREKKWQVATSAKIRRDLREDLTSNFPEADFHFFTSMEEAESKLSETDILLTYGEDVEAKHIQQAPSLKWINVLSAGVEEMPFDAIESAGILMTNSRGIHATPMAEYVLWAILDQAKCRERFEAAKSDLKWEGDLLTKELVSQTVVILGTGAIGTETARLAKAFRMKTVGVNTNGRSVEHFDAVFSIEKMAEAIKEADYLVNILPYTAKTDRLLGEAEFALLKKEAVFINVGRGRTVIEEELMVALEKEAFAHAVLDVFETEPLPEGSPLWKMPSVTLSPHVSGATSNYQPRALEVFKTNFRVFSEGRTDYVNRVMLTKGY